MYGWRGRVGLVHPSRGETLMYEFCKVAPEGVIPVGTALGVQRLTGDQLGAILDRYEAGVREMVYEECDVIQLGGTPPITSGLPGTEERLLERARGVASVPIFTGVQAEIEAMRAVGARRVAIGTPYTDALTEKFRAYFEAQGFEIPIAYGLGIEKNIELSKLPLHAAYRVAREVFERAGGAVDAVHLTCPRWGTITVLERLEQDLGVPVTSSSQSTIYGALWRLRIHDPIDGYGSLLASLGRTRSPRPGATSEQLSPPAEPLPQLPDSSQRRHDEAQVVERPARERIMDDDSLIAKYLEPNPNRPGPAEWRLKDSAVSVWAIIGYWLPGDKDLADVAAGYDILPIEVEAALAYYRRHRALIDGRLAANVG